MRPCSRTYQRCISLAMVFASVSGCSQLDTPSNKPEASRLSQLPPVPVPASNPMTPAKVALGKQLFFDKRISGSGQNSCESCHYRNLGWTDAQKLSKKDDGSMNTRHTPTLYNVGYLKSWYWDGRAATLEAQTMAAWRAQTGADPAKIAALLSTVPGYVSQFQTVFGSAPTPDTIVAALATYIRTKNSGDSPWDRHERGVKNAVSAEAKDGYDIFMGKGKCVICHSPPLYSNSEFYNIGLEATKEKKDIGRFNVTKAVEDSNAFKVPTLRSVAISGPYFHDGSVSSLEEAVRYMANTHNADPNKTPILTNVGLTDAEIKKVVAFLGSLTSDEPLVRPTLP